MNRQVKSLKDWTIVLLTFIVLFCNTVLAKYSGGSGEPNDPYQIADVNDLLTLANDVNDYNKCFIQTSDIDLDPNLPGGQVFTTAVIARDINNANYVFDGNAFSGAFDGAGNKIIKMTINTDENDYLSMFGCVNGGEIKNLYMQNFSINGEFRSYYLGGLVGLNSGSMRNCSSTGRIVIGTKESGIIGGLVGENSGSISNSSSAISLEGGYLYLGGLAGYNSGNITNCCSKGFMSACPLSSTGGLVGYNLGSISNCYSTFYVVIGGGLVGYNDGGINSSYFLITSGPNNGYGEPLTDEEMKQQSTFVGWDFVWETVNGPNDIWAICEDVNYPKLAWQYIVGDSDNDKDVDFTDFAPLGLKWLQTDSHLYCGGSDLTGDGLVNLDDLDAFVENWLQ